jgi:hypothetical protein
MRRRQILKQLSMVPAAGALALGQLSAASAQGAEKPSDSGFTYGDLKQETLQGRLLLLGALMERKYGARTTGAGPEKQWVLALPEGQLYTFLDNDTYRRLLAAGLADRAVEVTARHFPRSHLLEVLSFKEIAAELVKRRFHCNTCNIDSDDFGPCVCCGREMEVVKNGP